MVLKPTYDIELDFSYEKETPEAELAAFAKTFPGVTYDVINPVGPGGGAAIVKFHVPDAETGERMLASPEGYGMDEQDRDEFRTWPKPDVA